MGVGQKVLATSAVVVLVLGLLLYSPLHPDIDEPFKVRCFFTIFKIGKYLGDIGELFGYDKFVTQRILAEIKSDIRDQPVSDGIVMRTDVYDGVNVRIFEPESRSRKPRSALIYIHGGWFAIGSSGTYFATTDMLAYHLDAVVISVDYRLAPEHPFPAGFDDCYAVAMYVFNNAKTLHINPSDVGVAGDSAGGTLAAAVAQKLRDDGRNLQFRYQVLIYPVTQALTLDLPSFHANEWYSFPQNSRQCAAEALLAYIGEKRSLAPQMLAGNHTTGDIWQKYGHLVSLDNLHMDISHADFKQHYGIKDRTFIDKHSGFTHDALKKLIHPYAFPLMAESLKKLPPALVITCESDTLRDDGLLYIKRLRTDGVPVLHHHKRNSAHGYINFVKEPLWIEAARQTIADIVTFIEKI